VCAVFGFDILYAHLVMCMLSTYVVSVTATGSIDVKKGLTTFKWFSSSLVDL
jgi:hypothetical protein